MTEADGLCRLTVMEGFKRRLKSDEQYDSESLLMMF